MLKFHQKRLILQLFLSDLDFTLLRSDTTVSNFTKSIWNSAVSTNKLSVATARSFTGVQELLKGLHLHEPLILLDGAIIAKPNGDIVHMEYIDKELGDAIIDVGKSEFSIEPLIVTQGENCEEFYYPKVLNEHQKTIIKTMEMRNRIYCDGQLRAKEYNLKIVYQADKELAHALEQRLQSLFRGSIETKLSNDPYFDCYFLTILNPLGDKAHALRKLEEIEDISIENTTVFGDSHNDIGMFQSAGRKIAVANAIDELKKVANIVLKETNDEDAVAKYLKQELRF
ncbi:MAG TPA: HAD family phosphatase [Nitratifractor sp.]|nr:HAD family phosphatase [Nitratifractor sp.]HHD74884.1 HAD family phosphatase [Nitratifractor sp.]